MTVINVNNNNNDSSGSLREAISNASNGDVINFTISAGSTITLQTPITIDKNIEINGTDKNITISGGDTTSIFKINVATRHVVYNGYVYRTLLGADINGTTKYGDTEQTATQMPMHFSVAPDDSDIVQNVIAPYYWDIWRLCTENKCWATKHYGSDAGVEKDDSRNWEEVDGGYRVKDGNNYYRLLIRADVSQVPEIMSSNVTIKNITLKDGLAKGGDGERAGVRSGGMNWTGGGGGAGLGGAIAIENGSVTIDSVIFSDNIAKGGDGGIEPSIAVSREPGDDEDYAGGGGDSVFGGGTAKVYYGSLIYRRNGGFGGGGSGNNTYYNTGTFDSDGFLIKRAGGNGGFGGGGGGGPGNSFVRSANNYPAGRGGNGGLFAGNGSNGGWGNGGVGGDSAPGTGGGGAGLGGAIFIKAGTLTIDNSEFVNNEAIGGSGGTGTHSNISDGEPGQGVGGAIFIYESANVTFGNNNITYSNNSAQTGNNNIYIMDLSLPDSISTNYSTPPISGKSQAGSIVKLYNNLTLLGSAQADSDGNFTITSSELDHGNYSLTVITTEVPGSIVSASETISVSIDTSDSDAPLFLIADGISICLPAYPPNFGGDITSYNDFNTYLGSVINLTNSMNYIRCLLDKVTTSEINAVNSAISALTSGEITTASQQLNNAFAS